MKTYNKRVRLLGLVLLWPLVCFAQDKDAILENLVSGLPIRPYGAIYHDGSLYFSAEQNAGVDCPAAHSYRASKGGEKAVVETLSEFACVQDYQILGKHVSVVEGTQGRYVSRILQSGKWLSIADSNFGAVLKNRLAWARFELHKLADRAKDPTLVAAEKQSESLSHSVVEAKGLSLSTLLKSSSGKWVFALLPLEDDRPAARMMKVVEGLPTDWGKRAFRQLQASNGFVLFYESEDAAAAPARLFLWDAQAGTPVSPLVDKAPVFKHPSFVHSLADRFVLTESRRSITSSGGGQPSQFFSLDLKGTFTPIVVKGRDVSGLSVLDKGYVVSHGYSRQIGLVGTQLKWTANFSGVVAADSKNLKLPAWPRPAVANCTAHSLQQENETTWSIFSRTPQGAFALAYLQGVVSGGCNQDSLAVVSKSTSFVLENLNLALTPEVGNVGVDGGTNSAGALLLGQKDAARTLTSEFGLLQIFKGTSLVLVREPLSGTSFTRVRVRATPPGFRLWLSDAKGPFSSYLNIVNADGKEFYVEDIESQPFPEPDPSNFEMK